MTTNGVIEQNGGLGDLKGRTEYLKIRIICQEFLQAYHHFVGFGFFNLLTGIIVLTFVIFNSADIPVFLAFLIFLADVIAVIAGNFLFSLATDLHLLSQVLIKISLGQCRGRGRGRRVRYQKFWTGMRPLRVEIGIICSFETREFLLVIWGNVVISKIIDLLIASESGILY